MKGCRYSPPKYPLVIRHHYKILPDGNKFFPPFSREVGRSDAAFTLFTHLAAWKMTPATGKYSSGALFRRGNP